MDVFLGRKNLQEPETPTPDKAIKPSLKTAKTFKGKSRQGRKILRKSPP
jgi:hypothetical protein